MEKVTGRTDDMMIVRGVNVFPTQIEEQILTRRGPDPALPLRAHPPGPARRAHRPGRGASTPSRPATPPGASAGELVERVKDTVGVTVDVDVVAPGALERSLGKAKRIDDRR